jgi:hypothetical protein
LRATLLKAFLAWPRIQCLEAAGAHARGTLVREVLAVRRRPAAPTLAAATPPDKAAAAGIDVTETKDLVQ